MKIVEGILNRLNMVLIVLALPFGVLLSVVGVVAGVLAGGFMAGFRDTYR